MLIVRMLKTMEFTQSTTDGHVSRFNYSLNIIYITIEDLITIFKKKNLEWIKILNLRPILLVYGRYKALNSGHNLLSTKSILITVKLQMYINLIFTQNFNRVLNPTKINMWMI